MRHACVPPLLLWLDQRLALAGTTADEIVRAEHQQQGAMSVSVRNIITSMRLISEFDWPEFFETGSLVDVVLRKDTAFAEMDFSTRDDYRHAIENLALGSNLSEMEVALRVVRRVKPQHRGPGEGPADFNEASAQRQSEPGYHLISRGRRAFEREIGFHSSWKRWLLRLYIRSAVPGYLASISFVSAIGLFLPLKRFLHGSRGILSELLQFVAMADPIKISRLTLRNDSGRVRHLSITGYAEWVLGSSRSASGPYLTAELDSKTGAVFVTNVLGGEFGGRVAFMDMGGRQTSVTGDRTEFRGRHGALCQPAALKNGGPLSGKVGAGLDPCGALQTSIELRPGGQFRNRDSPGPGRK
jgi:Glycosyltransferase family 36